MTFAWPHLLWLLAAPLALLFWEAFRRLRQQSSSGHAKIVRAEAGASRVYLGPSDSRPPRRRLPRFWLISAFAFAIFALARPQWGRVEEQVFEQSREILLAVDISRSMNAPDVKPSRLGRAKLLIQALLDRLKGERVGLVVFSGTAFLQAPLSTDYEILREFLPDLKPGFLPEGGTNFHALIKTSVDAFGKEGAADRFLVILSDGEDLDENWRSLLPELKQKKVRVIALGVGTPEGAMIPDDEGNFVKDERGAVVMSRLAASTLQELARETGGAYRDASNWVDLAAVLRETIEAGRQGSFTDKREARAIERYQWALAPAFLCLLGSLCFEFHSRVRPRVIHAVERRHRGIPLSALTLLLLPATFFLPHNLQAQAAAAPAESPLFSTVKRLSEKSSLSAADDADFAKRTLEWGQGLQSSQQPVPDGPLRDALDAVTAGSKKDEHAADWSALRRNLETLRAKHDQQKKQQDKKDDKQQQKQNDKQSQDNQDKNQEQKQDQQQQQSDQKDQQKQDQQQQKQDQQKRESAFGKMDEKKQPEQQPKPEEMQQLGGNERKQNAEMEDPSMVLPLEKLEKVKDQDSPGRLFQLMEDTKKPAPAQNKKNW
jgi:Ca-activated chloride channel family protein